MKQERMSQYILTLQARPPTPSGRRSRAWRPKRMLEAPDFSSKALCLQLIGSAQLSAAATLTGHWCDGSTRHGEEKCKSLGFAGAQNQGCTLP